MPKKTRANEEGENEGETHVVTAIPIQPSFPHNRFKSTTETFSDTETKK